MSRRVVVVLAVALLAACGSEGDAGSQTSAAADADTTGATGDTASSPSPTGPVAYDVSGCPVDDEAFCETAVDTIDALQAGDADALFALSREDRLVCAKVNQDYFPGCETDDVLVGHGSSGATFIVEVLDEQAYRGQLEAVVTSMDPGFSDELGEGTVRVVGVGTCGPDIPRRRTYHLAWTTAVSEGGAPAERVLGSFEFLFKDDEWRIGLWYFSPLEEWEAEQLDPLELAFCEAGRTPWLAA